MRLVDSFVEPTSLLEQMRDRQVIDWRFIDRSDINDMDGQGSCIVEPLDHLCQNVCIGAAIKQHDILAGMIMPSWIIVAEIHEMQPLKLGDLMLPFSVEIARRNMKLPCQPLVYGDPRDGEIQHGADDLLGMTGGENISHQQQIEFTAEASRRLEGRSDRLGREDDDDGIMQRKRRQFLSQTHAGIAG